jgi:L-histidine N-alpha-methyltransferase
VVPFRDGEGILTEISRKFTLESLQGLLTAAGYSLDRHYQPENGYYSLVLARPAQL